MTAMQEQNTVRTSSNRSNRLVLTVFAPVSVIYMIVSLVLIVHTRKSWFSPQPRQRFSRLQELRALSEVHDLQGCQGAGTATGRSHWLFK